jgi:hypothetical protein
VCYLTMMTVKWDYVATVKDENEYGALVEWYWQRLRKG